MTSIVESYVNFLNPDVSPLSKILPKKIIPINWVINFQKAGTLFMMFILMIYYKNFSLGAWVYLALHGSYGIYLY